MPEIVIRPASGRRPRMLDPRQAARWAERISGLVVATVERHLGFAPAGAAGRAAAAVGDFLACYDRRPLADNKGGSQFNDSLWLFVLARVFQPDLVVECGTFQGHSAWLFRQARPDAEIHSFDVDLGRLACRPAGVVFHHGDWTESALAAPRDRASLVFFDDHVNQARRLLEAHRRGFRCLLFDDNYPAYNLYAGGGAAVPTLEMVMDPELADGTEIAWFRKGKRYDYRYRGDEAAAARALIEHYHVLPELAAITRYSAQSGLTVVALAA